MQCGLYRFGCCSVSAYVGITSSIKFHWKVNESNICYNSSLLTVISLCHFNISNFINRLGYSGKTSDNSDSDHTRAADVGCGSRHTVVLTKTNQLWTFGWNKYGQLGLGHNYSRDAPEKMCIPKSVNGKPIKMLKCGDWGTAIVVSSNKKP